MNRASPLSALLLLACAAAFAQPAAEEQQLLGIVAHAREQGCAARPAARSPLRWSPAVARAAARMESGEAPFTALDKEGYRGTRVFHARLTGYRTPAEVGAALAQHYCAALAEPQFRDFGFRHRGTQWMLVLAAPLEFPQLADPRAALSRVLALVNDARSHARRCGDRQFAPAPPLRWNALLEHAAAAHARDMAGHNVVEHQGSDGSTPAQRIARAGFYPWRSVGENVAGGQSSPDEVVEDWLASPGHCANIMEPGFAEMGAAFTVDPASRGVVYWAQEFGTR